MNKVFPVFRLIVPLLVWWHGVAATRAGQGEVPYDFFYAALQGSGIWLESANYGYVWQPRIAAEKSDWRPYTDGYWSHTDQGWTWVSYENFGWATYHYGRWATLADTGWIWVPGFEWAPAWVSWRASPSLTGRNLPAVSRSRAAAVGVEAEEVVGWAPLPPEATFNFARGFSPQVDLTFQIGPDFYNFVPVRYFGELVLRPWIFRPAANEEFIASTWNCTNVNYRPNPGFISSGGPSYWALRAAVQNPIAQLHLESQFIAATDRKGDVANRVENDRFVVAAPIVVPPSGQTAGSVGLLPGPSTIKPPLGSLAISVKPIDHGWTEPQRDSTTAATLRDQIKHQAADAPTTPMPPTGLVPSANVIRVAGPTASELAPAKATSRVPPRRAMKVRSSTKNPRSRPADMPVPKKLKAPSRTLPQPAAGDASAN
jgi:hypothetical protein